METILLPVDVPEAKVWQKSIDTAIELAKREGAALHVLWVVPEFERRLGVRPVSHKPEMQQFVEQTFPDMEVKPILKAGSVHKEIRDTAKQIDADLIVMGARNPRLTDVLMGSNAANVALHGRCSVYVVR